MLSNLNSTYSDPLYYFWPSVQSALQCFEFVLFFSVPKHIASTGWLSKHLAHWAVLKTSLAVTVCGFPLPLNQ